MEIDNYYLLDSRAGALALENDGVLDVYKHDCVRYILLIGTLKECCKYANSGNYGDLCVVSNYKFEIPWHLVNGNGHWSIKNKK